MCTTNFSRPVTSEMMDRTKEDKQKKLAEYKNKPNKSCNDCKIVMTALEPTIIIVYKLWVEREGLKDIIYALVGSVVFGTGMRIVEDAIEKSGALNDLKLLDENGSNSEILEKLKTAVVRSLFCLGKGGIKTIKEFRKYNAKNCKSK